MILCFFWMCIGAWLWESSRENNYEHEPYDESEWD